MSEDIQHDDNRKREALASPVRVDGQNEDPALKAFLDPKSQELPAAEQLVIARQVQAIIEGSISQAMKEFDQRMMGYLDEMEKRRTLFEQDQQKFWDKVNKDYDRNLIKDPEARKEQVARDQQKVQAWMQEASAKVATDKIRLAEMPKENVVWPGEIIMFRGQGGNQDAAYEPISFMVGSVKFPPPGTKAGEVIEVPSVVAEILRNRERSQQEAEEFDKLLQSNPKDTVLAKVQAEIEEKYQTPVDDRNRLVPVGTA